VPSASVPKSEGWRAAGSAEDPCEKLREIDQSYTAVRENRQRIRDTGLEAWLAQQAAQVEAGFSYLDALNRGQ